jgi:hypothetical protein
MKQKTNLNSRQAPRRRSARTVAAVAITAAAALLPVGALTMTLLGAGAQHASARAAAAQVPFRILRPVSGATVRETVRVQIPRAAVAEAAYFSVYIDDRFRAAIEKPGTSGTNKPQRRADVVYTDQIITYLWDTKAPDRSADARGGDQPREIKDGRHTIEIVAHDARGKRLGEQRITVNVANRTGLNVPPGGVPLAYRFRVGDQSVYRQRTEVNYIGDRPAGGGFGGGGGFIGGGGGGPYGGGGGPYGGRGGGRFGGGRGPYGAGPSGLGGSVGGGLGSSQATGSFEVLVQRVQARYLRNTEDSLGGGAFLIRDKVLGGTIQSSSAAARLEEVYDFKSRYRTVRSTGEVVSYGTPSATKPGAYVALPIIDLGGGRRRVGQTWQTRAPILLEWASLDAPPTVRVTNRLEGMEWQNGYQTARILQTYRGKANVPLFGGAGKMMNADVDMQRIIFFGYSAGRMIRTDTTTTVNGRAPADIIAAMAPGRARAPASAAGAVSALAAVVRTGAVAVADLMRRWRRSLRRRARPVRRRAERPGRRGPQRSGWAWAARRVPGGFPGGVGGATQQAAPVEARFRSTTTVEYVAPGR